MSNVGEQVPVGLGVARVMDPSHHLGVISGRVNINAELSVESLEISGSLFTLADGSDHSLQESTTASEESISGNGGIGRSGVSNSFSPSPIEFDFRVSRGVVCAAGKVVRSGQVVVEEDTIVESLIDVIESTGSGGILDHVLDDGSIGGTSKEVLGILDVLVDRGEGKVPVIVMGIEVEFVHEVQEGSVVVVNADSLHELGIALGLVNTLEGEGKGSVELFELNSPDSDSSVIGEGESLGQAPSSVKVLPVGGSSNNIEAVTGVRLVQLEITPNTVEIVLEVLLGITQGGIVLKDELISTEVEVSIGNSQGEDQG